jgi:hypothetical protein
MKRRKREWISWGVVAIQKIPGLVKLRIGGR